MIALDGIRTRLLAGEPLVGAECRTVLDALDKAVAPGQRLRERNAALRRLADRVYADAPSTRAKAGRLSDALKRYASTAWPRDRAATATPARLAGRVEGEMWRLFKVYGRVPTSVRMLQDILK